MQYVEFPLEERISAFIYRVFGFMAMALAITAGTAFYVSRVPSLYKSLLEQPTILFAVLLIQIFLVVVLSLFITRLSFVFAALIFFVYAVSLGYTLSVIFLAYTQASIFATFLTTATMFGAMSLYGYFTKADLSTIGNMATMALFGLIIGMLVNLWLGSSMFEYVLSAIGVVVFTLLTAYDVQKIKQLGQQLIAQREAMNKVAIVGALTLYLDFINLFLFLLRFTGQRKGQ